VNAAGIRCDLTPLGGLEGGRNDEVKTDYLAKDVRALVDCSYG
jgi:hypothetical protein